MFSSTQFENIKKNLFYVLLFFCFYVSLVHASLYLNYIFIQNTHIHTQKSYSYFDSNIRIHYLHKTHSIEII
jgi:hypothetical protein